MGQEPDFAPNIRLLPGFDPYLLGHTDKSHLVSDAPYKKVYRKAGWISAVVLDKGRAAATWSYKQQGSKVILTVEPFTSFSDNDYAQIEEIAADFGRFLGASCRVQIQL